MTRFLATLLICWMAAGVSACAYDLTNQGKECDSEHPCPSGLVCTEQGEILVCLPPGSSDGGFKECTQDVDCDDEQLCTADTCVANVCQNETQPNPGAEGLAVEGTCSNQTDDDCDGLTDDQDGDCHPCQEGQGCDDGNDCTHGDTCTEGVCAGTEYSCDDQNECTDDSCDGQGGCSQINNSEPCDDSDPCTHTDTCSEGACSGSAYTCDDLEPCTDDSCNGDATCAHVDNVALCDDADPCTRDDTCDTGACAGVEYSCDDGNECTSDSCIGDGTCSFIDSDGACNDNNPCTQLDMCVEGQCRGEPYSCDDGNMCTDDICDGDGGCTQENSVGPCDDGFFCNGQDACDGLGDCAMHAGNPCGVHTCDEDFDVCEGVGEAVFSQIVIGYYHTCGLTPTGVAYCWGDDEYGQLGNGGGSNPSQVPIEVDTSLVSGETAFVQLAGGFYHTCGLTGKGVAYCWGWDLYGQLGDGGVSSDAQRPVAINLDPIAGEQALVQLTGGGWHTCGLTARGMAYCWGRDQYGQLGDGLAGDDSQSPAPVDTTPVGGEKTLTWLRAGYYHTCALTSQGAAYCWGRDFEGQLGDGGVNDDSPVPVAVDIAPLAGLTAFVRLDGGGWHTCGLTVEGIPHCWGNDFNGQLGDGGTGNDSQSPVEVDLTPIDGEAAFVRLSAGGWHSCGLTSQRIAYCWGRDEYGQLGDGGTSQDTQEAVRLYSFPFQGGDQLLGIASGAYHTCGLTPAGAAYCWGRDDYGQLGDGGASNDSQIPVAVDASAFSIEPAFVQITTGGKHSCGLTSRGAAYCWGIDDSGQLGDGGLSADSQSPVPVITESIDVESRFVLLSAGGKHTCGLTADGRAYCWGSDMKGQLGDGGSNSDSQFPVAVDTAPMTSLKTFVQLVTGEDFTCGRTASGLAYCWGNDSHGQLGNGDSLDDSAIPGALDTGPVKAEPGWAQLAAGSDHACGLTGAGVVYCWGNDHAGQLGNGPGLTDSQYPVAVDIQNINGDQTFSQLTAGNGHTCGLTGDASAYCWGSDNSGQLGDGGVSAGSQFPVAIDPTTTPGQTALIQIAAGDQHTCAVTAEGTAYCWGKDDKGQLCDGGVSADSQSPVAIEAIGGAVVSLAAGGKHGCGIGATGVVYCCGDDGHGQLGNGGSSQDSQSPSEVDSTTIR